MTPTSAPDLPENYEQLKDYVLNIHAESHQWVVNGIKQTFALIEKFGFTLTRPQSEASALATPVGWRPPSSDPSAIQVHVVSYDSEKHQLNCRFPDGIVREVNPFVGCAIECTDDDYVEKGEACVGKDFIMSGSWRHGPYLCHRFDEIPAPPHTEERG